MDRQWHVYGIKVARTAWRNRKRRADILSSIQGEGGRADTPEEAIRRKRNEARLKREEEETVKRNAKRVQDYRQGVANGTIDPKAPWDIKGLTEGLFN